MSALEAATLPATDVITDPASLAGLQPRRGGVGAVRDAARRRATDQCGRDPGGGAVVRGAPGADRAAWRRDGSVRRRERDRRFGDHQLRADERDPADRPRGAARGRAARCDQRRPAGRGRRTRPLVPARSRQLAVVDHRRQRRHQRRRRLLRQVRRHPRLRPGARGGHRHRRAGPAGPADREGCRRLRPGRTAGRLRGHPRVWSPRSPYGCVPPRLPSTRWSASSTPWSPPARRWRRSRGPE